MPRSRQPMLEFYIPIDVPEYAGVKIQAHRIFFIHCFPGQRFKLDK